MYFNVWAGALREVVDYIKTMSRDVDLFCLSEVHNLLDGKVGESRRYMPIQGKKEREHELNLFKLLQEVLVNTHIGYHSPGVAGIHDLEETDIPVEYGLATFVRRNLFPYTYRTGSLHRPLGEFNEGRPASRSIVSITLPCRSSQLLVGHMHGLWDGQGKIDTPDRHLQSARALEFLRNHRDFEARGARIPVVFGGDFNLTNRTSALRMLVSSKVFGPDGGENLNEKFAVTCTRTEHYKKEEPEADFVIASSWLKAKLTTDQDVPSDHAVLLVDIDP
ncbi:MAG: endonuclease/exonuclease/phosphatase family protein [Candidatus Paceibacteria bacterium]